jgi:acetoin utilization deacetylase AcuC-like enzyme
LDVQDVRLTDRCLSPGPGAHTVINFLENIMLTLQSSPPAAAATNLEHGFNHVNSGVTGINPMVIFYRPEQVAVDVGTMSPSAFKPKQVLEDWQASGLINAGNICSFEPVSRDDIKRVHNPQMVDDVLDLRRRNGFRNTDAQIAASLLYTSGSMLAAARWAVAHRCPTCSPTSGFHHAGFDEPEGYCTFNGLMVTAVKLLDEGLVRSVAILDCDVHEGNGTQDIINRLGLHTQIQHHSMGYHFQTREQAGPAAAHFETWLQDALAQCTSADLVLYQASADPHVDDPLGGVLTADELLRRDEAVFRTLRHKPLVWNLAGGYQRDAAGGIDPVLELHRSTMLAWMRVLNTCS